MTQSQRLAAAEEKQRSAADPAVSAWVRANAGTGKTHVLVQRILRLLLTGAEPRSILCLTFTKNAAAEMEMRVLSKLGEWATSSDADLKDAAGQGPVASARSKRDRAGPLPVRDRHRRAGRARDHDDPWLLRARPAPL